MPTGQQVREAIIDKRRELAFRGKTTAIGGNTAGSFYLTDTTRLQMKDLSSSEFGDAYVRITSGTDDGFVGKVDHIDPENGRLYFSPDASAAIASGVTYEVWRHGIRPDEPDKARDAAAQNRTSRWRFEPLSIFSRVETWTTDIVGGETATPTTLAFPSQYFTQSLLVDNNSAGANGGIKSESMYVQDDDSLAIFGFVSVRSGTAEVRLRDVSNSAFVTLQGASTFTLRGWQIFRVTAQLPADCGEVQLYVGGQGAADITEWAGVGCLSLSARQLVLPSSVRTIDDVGGVYVFDRTAGPANRAVPLHVEGMARRPAGAGVVLDLDRYVCAYPAYYEERHFYDALQSDYLAVSDRTTGDAASTDCLLEYIEAATVVELLENMPRNDVLERVYQQALVDLEAWDAKECPPYILSERTRGRSPLAYRSM